MKKMSLTFAIGILIIALAQWALPVWAAQDPADPFEQAQQLIDQGEPREAIALLKTALSENPDSGLLTRLLAYAYAKQGNRFWAMKTLMDHATRTGDCESYSIAAWQSIKDAQITQALAILEGPVKTSCTQAGPGAARWQLLLAAAYHFQKDDKKVLDHLNKGRAHSEIFPEDQELLAFLEAVADQGAIPPLSVRFEFGAGWNSNALLSSVTDSASAQKEVDSFLWVTALDIRFVAPISQMFRPVIEYRDRVKAFTEKEAADEGFYEASPRAGFILGYAPPRIGLYYANQDLYIFGGDQYQDSAYWLYEAHRGEFEFEITPRILWFGGGGKRFFRERARTRNEFDTGLATRFPIRKGIALTNIIAGRYYDALIPAYNQYGGTALLSLHVPYYRDGYVRPAGSVALDEYPDSTDYFESEIMRKDRQIKGGLALWSPSWHRMTAGLTYQYTDRKSTVENYTFKVHELMLKIAWKGSFNPWAPGSTLPDKHVPIQYGIYDSGASQERLQELLRQEESAQRSSSCAD